MKASGPRIAESSARDRPTVSRPRGVAYTLFEMVLVLALILVFLAISYPSLEAMYGDFRVQTAMDGVRAAWAQARARAVEDGRSYAFGVVPSSGNYRIAPEGADYWDGDPPTIEDELVPPLVMTDSLPKGVRFQTPTSGLSLSDYAASLPADQVPFTDWEKMVTFLPDGTAREDIEIVFEARGARPMIIRLRALTGVITVRPYVAGQEDWP